MTPAEHEDLEERIAIILEGNPGMTEEQATVIAHQCLQRARSGYPITQSYLPWRQSA